MNVKEILQRRPPAVLHHYTTQQGLLGIIGSGEIWASHNQYLNDVREFRHAVSLVEEELASMTRAPWNGPKLEVLKNMQADLTGIEDINVCVCSFSEVADVLSQWRAYGGQASGFSVGFSGEFLRAVSDALGFWLVPVLYEEDAQRAFIRTLLADVVAENIEQQAKQDGDVDDARQGGRPGGNLVAYLNRYAPILKHRSFAEEKEWRIVSRPLICSRDLFAYRPGASMLIPYFRIPLHCDGWPFSVDHIRVGPTPHPQLSVNSVRWRFPICRATWPSRQRQRSSRAIIRHSSTSGSASRPPTKPFSANHSVRLDGVLSARMGDRRMLQKDSGRRSTSQA